MSHLVSAVQDIFSSIYELIASVVTSIYSLFAGAVDIVVSFIAGIFSLISHTVVGVLDVLGETGKFIFGNVFIILVIAGGAFVFLKYQQQQGNTVKVGDKKLN